MRRLRGSRLPAPTPSQRRQKSLPPDAGLRHLRWHPFTTPAKAL